MKNPPKYEENVHDLNMRKFPRPDPRRFSPSGPDTYYTSEITRPFTGMDIDSGGEGMGGACSYSGGSITGPKSRVQFSSGIRERPTVRVCPSAVWGT